MQPGRPPLFKTPEELQSKADEYFAECETSEEPPTINGLSLALGFQDRSSLRDYRNREGFSYTMKRIITRLEGVIEQRMLTGEATAGHIFWLKNHGWKDERHNENRHTIDFAGKSDEELMQIIEGEDA